MKKLNLLFCLMASGLVWSQPLLISQGTALGNPNNPTGAWANVMVEITDSTANLSMTRYATTDANGFFIDSFPALDFVGHLSIKVYDCNNQPTSWNFTYQFAPGSAPAIYTVNFLDSCLQTSGSGANCNFQLVATPGGTPGFYSFYSTYMNTNPNSVYNWDFGDGNTGTGSWVGHTYSNPGTYQYCLSVDSCLVCDTLVVGGGSGTGSNMLYASGYVLGNATPSGAWANTAVVINVDNWFFQTVTDQNGFYADSIPASANTGVIQASLLDCNGNYIYGNVTNYDISTGQISTYDTLTTPCIAGPSPVVGNVFASGYVLDTNGVPMANYDVGVTVNNTQVQLVTDGTGYYSDSIPVLSTVGIVVASTLDCNGIPVFGNPDFFDLTLGINTAHDTLVICSSPGSSGCQAEFIVDTVNSFGGNVYLWNTSTPNNPAMQAQYIWDFGDGSISNNPYPSHQYTQPGMYQVCLTMITPATPIRPACTSVFCDSLGMDANGNLIYKGQTTGFNLIVVDPATIGQDEFKLENLKAYPNPTSDMIRLNGFNGTAQYQLMDLSGKQLKVGEIEADMPIDLSNISRGLYLMDVTAEGKRGQVRILIGQ